jgi:hypothetical protein
MKFLFAPIGIGAGLLAGLLAQKAFERIWGFAQLTGAWPGDEGPDS